MDEKLEALRRAFKADPADRGLGLRLARGLEKAGRFEDAWDVLEALDARRELAALAARHLGGPRERGIAVLPFVIPLLASGNPRFIEQAVSLLQSLVVPQGEVA